MHPDQRLPDLENADDVLLSEDSGVLQVFGTINVQTVVAELGWVRSDSYFCRKNIRLK